MKTVKIGVVALLSLMASTVFVRPANAQLTGCRDCAALKTAVGGIPSKLMADCTPRTFPNGVTMNYALVGTATRHYGSVVCEQSHVEGTPDCTAYLTWLEQKCRCPGPPVHDTDSRSEIGVTYSCGLEPFICP